MPSRNIVREFATQGFYHVYNRGEGKINIFSDDQDYRVFLYYLQVYLLPLEKVLQKYRSLPLRLYCKNMSAEVELLAYCLMPNHFHLLLFQKPKDGVPKLLKQLSNAYTLYFNSKYQHTGGLFPGRYKAVTVTNLEQALHLSRYIHLNPMVSEVIIDIRKYLWSSYNDYLTPNENALTRSQLILSAFPNSNAYEQFVLDQVSYGKDLEQLKHLLLD
ncbi:MAG: transposase [bacterium]|nr:transposase [bacterium]